MQNFGARSLYETLCLLDGQFHQRSASDTPYIKHLLLVCNELLRYEISPILY
jgi:hypothetical protein